MPKNKLTENDFFTINEAAKLLKISAKTLRRWEAKGLIVPVRTDGGHRRYRYEDIISFKKIKNQKKKIVTRNISPIESTRWIKKINENIQKVNDHSGTENKQAAKTESSDWLGVDTATVLDTNRSKNKLRKFAGIATSFLLLIAAVISVKAAVPGVVKIANNFFNSSSTNSNEPNKVLAEKIELKEVTYSVNVPSEFNSSFLVNSDATISGNLSVLGGTNIVGSLNLEGNTLTSTGDLTISPTGGAVIIGTGGNPTIDLANGDLFISGELEVATSITLNGDSISDFTGTGLTVSNGTLSTSLGTSVSPSEIDTTNDAENGKILSYDSDSGNFKWVSDQTGDTSPFTTTSSVVNLVTATNDLTLGSSTDYGKLGIEGDSDEIQFLARAYSTQTNDVFVVEQSSGTDIFSIGNTGNVTLTDSSSSNINFNLSSTGDFTIQDNGTTFATFTDSGTFTLDNLQLDGNTISSTTGNLTLSSAGSIVLSGLDCTSFTNGGALTADASGVISCSNDDGGGGTSDWTSGGGVVYLQTTTNNVNIGGTANLGKLAVDGDTDEVQLLIQGNSTQTNYLGVFEQSTGTDVFTISNNGDLVTAGDLAVNGGDITSSASTVNVLNGTPTTINIGGNATAITLGSNSGTTTFNHDVTVNGTLTTAASNFAADGASTFSPSGTNDVTMNLDADSTLILNGVQSGTASSGICLDASNNIITCSTIGSVTLKTAYDNDADGSDAIIQLTSADDSVVIRNPASGGTNSSYVFQVDQLSSGTTDNVHLTQVGTGTVLDVTSSSTGKLLNLTTSGAVTTADGVVIAASNASGVITDAIDASDAEIVNALNIGANTITGTTGIIDLTNFDVASTGNITVAAGVGLDTNASGTLAVGTTNATALSLGSSGATFALASSGGLNVSTSGALTGVASIDTISVSATALTFAGAGTISSTTTSAITLDSGTTGAVNLGTGNSAKTINVGTGTAGNTINVGTDNTTADTINVGSALDTLSLVGTTGITGATTINGSGSAATNIGTGTSTGTITIGRTSGTDLALNDANWNISGAGAANFVSIGATTPGTGAFTTLTSSGNTDLGDAASDTISLIGSLDTGINFLDADSSSYTIAGADASTATGAAGDLTLRAGAGGGTSGNGGNLVLAGGTQTSGTAGYVAFQTDGSERLRVQSDGTFLFEKGSNDLTLAVSAPTGGSWTLTVPALSGNADICTTAGNCTGSGGGSGVTYTSQTTNALTKFTSNSGEITSSVITDSGSLVAINDNGNDVDLRAETDTNANAFVLDAGQFSGVGQLSIGSAAQVTATAFVVVDNPAISATANQDFYKLFIDNNAAITVPTGTAPLVASLAVDEPNITATGTVTTAATVYVSGAPTEGSSNYALYIDAGTSRFDGDVNLTGISSGTGSTLCKDGSNNIVTCTVGSGGISGSGTGGTLPVFSGSGASSDITDSWISQSGTTLTIGTAQTITASSATALNLGAATVDFNGAGTLQYGNGSNFTIADDGGNNIFKLTGASDLIEIGNATDNNAITLLGTGQKTINGNLDVSSGLDVTGASLTVGGSNASITTGGAITGTSLTDGTGTLSSGALSGITGYTQSSGNFSISGTGTFGTGTGAISLNGLTTISKTLSANSGSTQSNESITFASPADSTGTNVSQALDISPTIGNATGGTNTANLINLGAVSGDAQVTLNAVNIGALTGTAASETALNIASGWDNVLVVNSTAIINGSGVLQNSGLSGTYSNALTLSSSSNAFTGTIGQSTPLAGSFTTLSSTGATTIGNNSATVAINSSDWDITTTGDISGAGAITADGAIAFTPGSTSDITFTLDADSTLILSGVQSGTATNGLCLDTDNNVITCSTTGTVTLQTAYDNDADGLDTVIQLKSADDSLIFQNPSSLGTDSSFILKIDQLASSAIDGIDVSQAGTGTGITLSFSNATTTADGLLINNSAGTLTDAIDVSDATGITNAINVGANKILGTTGAIDYTNFDVASTGAITIAAGVGLDTNASGSLLIGDTTATTVSIGSTAATTLNLGASGALTRSINIGTGTGADTINIGTGGTGADAITIGNTASSTALTLNTGTGGISASSTSITGNAFSISDTALTTGAALSITASSAPSTAASVSNGAVLNLTNAATTNATTYTGLDIKLTNNPSVSGNTEYGARIQNQVTNNATDNAVSALLLLDNADTSTGGSTVVTDALRITNSGAISGGITNAINIASTSVTTDIALQNGETIDNDTNGTVNIGTTTLKLTGGTTIVSDQTTVSLLDSTTTTINFGSAATTLNIADAAITGTIDIGGVTADGASTVNIATNSTSADAITIGNANTSTTVAITGGDDWSISSAGAAVFNGNVTLGNANTDTLTINAGSSGSGITLADTSFANCTLTTVSNVLTCGSSSFTSFTAAGDTGGGQTITNGNTLSILGGTNGIDTVDSATDTVTINLDTTEITNATFGSGSGYTWTFDAGVTDPTLTFASDQITIGGASTLSATGVSTFNCTDCINFDDLSDALTLDAATTITNGTTGDFSIDLTSTGDFIVKDSGTAIATYADTGAISFAPTSGQNFGVTAAGAGAINLTTSTGAQTFTSSVATGTTTSSAFAFIDNSLTTGTEAYISSTSITQGKLLQLSSAANTLTSGTLLDVSTTSTALTSGKLASFDWSPGSATTASGDLFNINIGTNGTTTGSIFSVSDTGSNLFSVAEAQITSAVPHQFTAAGDVSIAYDLQFTNQTSSSIKTNAPLTIDVGESAESNNLTLQTYNSGQVVVASASGQLKMDVQGWIETNLNNSNSSTEAVCGTSSAENAENSILDDCTTSVNADYAEVYPAESNVEYGDIVVAGSSSINIDHTNVNKDKQIVSEGSFSVTRVAKSQTAYEGTILGVASNNWSDFSSTGGYAVPDGENPTPVALSGRVPVKIANTSEGIVPGDYLTSSDVPGKAMKATQPGRVIGIALGYWNPNQNQDKVLVFIDNTYLTSEQLYGSSSNSIASVNITQLQNDFDTLVKSSLTATSSGIIANFDKVNTNSLSVLGDTILADTIINGKLNVGTLTFDNVDQSINAVGTLKIQSLALGNIELQGGLVVIDTLGNVVVNTISAQQYKVAGASAGSSTIVAGSTSTIINTTAVSANSLIFVTPKTGTSLPLSVTSKNLGASFTVSITSPSNHNIDFDWWIVEKVN